MKILAALIITCFAFRASAQSPSDGWLYGTWEKQGYAFGGSFYPVNAWNGEKLVLKEDYSFSATAARIADNRVVTGQSQGKWSFSASDSVLRLYSGEERFSAAGQVYLPNRESEIVFAGKDYFVVREQKGAYFVESRFRREGSSLTFEESVSAEKQRQEALIRSYNPDASYYYLVNSLKPKKKKKLYYDEDYFDLFTVDHYPDAGIQKQKTNYNATISGFTDSTILLKVYSESTTIDYQDGRQGTIGYEYGLSPVSRQIRLANLDHLYDNRKTTLATVSAATLTASILTTLIVAPLVSIGYNGGSFNQQRYFTTAGIGLIGIGVSIPLLVIASEKPFHIVPLGRSVSKNNWYLQKVGR